LEALNAWSPFLLSTAKDTHREYKALPQGACPLKGKQKPTRQVGKIKTITNRMCGKIVIIIKIIIALVV